MIASLPDDSLLHVLAFLDVQDLLQVEVASKGLFLVIRHNRVKLRKYRTGVAIGIATLDLRFRYQAQESARELKFEHCSSLRIYGHSGKHEEDAVAFIAENSFSNHKKWRVFTSKPYDRLEECLGCVARNFETHYFAISKGWTPVATLTSVNELRVRCNILGVDGRLQWKQTPFFDAFHELQDLRIQGLEPGLNDANLLRLRHVRRILASEVASEIRLSTIRQLIEEFRAGRRSIQTYDLRIWLNSEPAEEIVLKAIHECSELCPSLNLGHVTPIDDNFMLTVYVSRQHATVTPSGFVQYHLGLAAVRL